MQVAEKKISPIAEFAEGVIDRHTANFWLQKVNPLWSVHQSLGKVIQKDHTAADMVSLTIQINKHFKPGMAGQHHPVFVTIGGVRYERTYSLTQLDAHHVLLTVKKVDSGKVSQWFLNEAKAGDILEFGLPYGEMTLPEHTQSLVLLAAGSGITPMFSMLKMLSQNRSLQQRQIHLLYWVKHYSDVAFKQRFEQMAEQNPDFSFQVFYTQEGDKRLNNTHAAQFSHLEQSTVYACGPSGFVAAAQEHFFSAKALKCEAFSLTQLEQSLEDEHGFINVTLTRSDKVVAIPKGQSILTGLEQQNIKPTFGCRMGVCHKCVCSKVQGSTRDLLNGKEHHEQGSALKICVSSAQTDLVIDL